MTSTYKALFTLAVLLTITLGAVYGIGQQILRQSANDPQIQLAEDWADQIVSGTSPISINMGAFIDPNHSLAPFGIAYDQDGNIANSSVTAPTTMLQPGGVLSAVDAAPGHELRFTWQPVSGTRFATVIKRAVFGDKTYYVLAARNLREVDRRVDNLAFVTFSTWVAGILLVFVSMHTHVAGRALRRLRKRSS
jgi:hypothetical protein